MIILEYIASWLSFVKIILKQFEFLITLNRTQCHTQPKFMFILHISGPFHLNGCPLRRINQIYTIATKTKLDISGVKLPERLNDKYFNRKQLKKPRHTEGEIFDTKKEVCSLL